MKPCTYNIGSITVTFCASYSKILQKEKKLTEMFYIHTIFILFNLLLPINPQNIYRQYQI